MPTADYGKLCWIKNGAISPHLSLCMAVFALKVHFRSSSAEHFRSEWTTYFYEQVGVLQGINVIICRCTHGERNKHHHGTWSALRLPRSPEIKKSESSTAPASDFLSHGQCQWCCSRSKQCGSHSPWHHPPSLLIEVGSWEQWIRYLGTFMSHIINLSQPLRKLLTKNLHLRNSIKTHVVSKSNGCSSPAGTHIGSSMHGHSACKEIQSTNQ